MLLAQGPGSVHWYWTTKCQTASGLRGVLNTKQQLLLTAQKERWKARAVQACPAPNTRTWGLGHLSVGPGPSEVTNPQGLGGRRKERSESLTQGGNCAAESPGEKDVHCRRYRRVSRGTEATGRPQALPGTKGMTSERIRAGSPILGRVGQ